MVDLKAMTNDLVPSVRQDGESVVASIRGEIDMHNSPTVRGSLLQILAQSKPRKLVLNLAQVPYMDSSAVAVLVEAMQKMRRTGGKIYLTNLQPRVKGLMEIARLDTIFVCVPEEADALTAR